MHPPLASVGSPPSHTQVACVPVTAAMHLIFLVAISWMLVEGLLLWSKVVAKSMRPSPRMTLYYATMLLCSHFCPAWHHRHPPLPPTQYH